MTTDELERLLEGAEETDALEFKQAMPWSPSLIKDILAMANVRDGGRIVIGIEDGTFVRQNLSDEDIATYNIDVMKDRVASYADPMAIVRSEVVADRHGNRLVVITVEPFDWLPVVCKRDSQELKAGTVYFRTRSRRPQSAPIANSTDMLDILLRASVSVRERLEAHGYHAPPAAAAQLDDELEGL